MIEAFLKPTSAGSRRDLLRSVGMVALGGGSMAVFGACSGSDETSAEPGGESAGQTGGQTGGPTGGESTSAGSSSAPAGSADGLTVAKGDVPEGSGVIDGDYVVTQPNAGEFKAFSSVCTHQGCPVSDIADGRIICNCHGSEFSIADGSVVTGPAEKPLAAATLEDSGDSVAVSL